MENDSAELLSRNDIGYLLARALQRWNELLATAFARRGFAEVRPALGAVLVPLFDEDGIQIVDLAARSGLSKQTLTTHLRALEEQGLVRREPHPHDRRAQRVFLTERGRAFERVARQALAELDALVARAFTTGEAGALRRALTTLERLGEGEDMTA